MEVDGKWIVIDMYVYTWLKKFGQKSETFNDIIRRLTATYELQAAHNPGRTPRRLPQAANAATRHKRVE